MEEFSKIWSLVRYFMTREEAFILAGLESFAPPEKIALVQQTLPPANVHPMNLYPFFDQLPIWNLRVARPFGAWNAAALFNWDDEAKEISVSFGELGLDPAEEYVLYEFWTGEFFGARRETFSVEVPPRAVRLMCIAQGDPRRPKFISSSRHIAQGAVDLTEVVPEGKGRMDAASFIRGRGVRAGDKLGAK